MYQNKKVAVFHWGQISIHTYYLVLQLHRSGIMVELFLYTPLYANKAPFLVELVDELKCLLPVFEIRCNRLEASIIKLNRVTKLLRIHTPLVCINPFLPAKTRKIFRTSSYTSIITVAQSSLFWLYKTDHAAIGKVLHYSLEVERTIDTDIPKFTCLDALIRKETDLLPLIDRLIIQDKDRGDTLLAYNNLADKVCRLYLPVSIQGEKIINTSNYLHHQLQIPTHKKIILYFGAIYRQRLIEEMIEVCEQMQNDDYVLVLHGAGNFSHLIHIPNRVKASNKMIPFSQVDQIIASATIAFSFYDNTIENNKLTAFSSEKIARYLQAGVPFIALKNDNYLRLQKEFDCCMLVENFLEVESAIDTISTNYAHYRHNCYKAYDKYFNISNSIDPILEHITGK